METSACTKVEISVRDLVEFILRAGDLDNRMAHGEMTSMQEGSRLHRKLQKAAGDDYRAEVMLKHEAPAEYDGESFLLCIQGRADGIYSEKDLQRDKEKTDKAEASESRTDTPGEGSGNGSGTSSKKLADENELNTPAKAVNTEIKILTEEAGNDDINRNFITYIDEIKTTLRNVMGMEEAVPVHRAQAMCYAYIYALQHEEKRIGVRMTYCNQDTEEVRYFYDLFEFDELKEWFEKLITEYAKWAAWEVKWKRVRDASIAEGRFPFEYREGQKKLVGSVYRTIDQGKRIFIEAPTGVGKTISTVFPAVWSLGEGKVSKIFYGTAKTIARTVAEETFAILVKRGMKLKCVTITSKENICLLEKPDCNPVACERARGHFDRVNDAVYDMLTHEELVDRTTIERYAEKHMVCPFEMSLDVATWSDAVICDYNYIFDPRAHLRRFFDEGSTGEYCFLIDEAHNLVERARDMYSAGFVKEDFLAAKAALKAAGLYENGGANNKISGKFENDGASSDTQNKFSALSVAENSATVTKTPGRGRDRRKAEFARTRISSTLEACNKALLAMKRECEDFDVWEDCDRFVMALTRFVGVYDDVSKDLRPEDSEKVIDLYFEARHFLTMHEAMDGDYTIYTDYAQDGKFRLRLQCMEPRRNLGDYLVHAKSSVFFSATLLPVKYYMEQLGGREDDYAVYADSPFDTKRRLLLVGTDVSTKYTRRGEDEYSRIARYITTFTRAKRGNYIVFFPSYKMMEDVREMIGDGLEGIVMQGRSMSETEKEDFLHAFAETPDETRIGFCVMGGIFAEGIDLQGDRLIGVAVVGTGLPMVCNERELFRGYFDEKNRMGFEYSYLYSGMNKVMQAAGRVIRTNEDVGAILLLDERFTNRQYLDLFPREWADWERVTADTLEEKITGFWKRFDG